MLCRSLLIDMCVRALLCAVPCLLLTEVSAHRSAFVPISSWSSPPKCQHQHLTSQRKIGQRAFHVGPCLATPHPAVEGWPEKYAGAADGTNGPKPLHTVFAVEAATEETKEKIDVSNWPTWTTAGNSKWAVGKKNKDKIMPYSELNYVVSGKLEIIPPPGAPVLVDGLPFPEGVPVLVQAGDFVTFPEGFTSSWTVLEELTWHYYLY